MNMNVKIVGVPEQIIDRAIKAGIAKTKTAVLMLGVLELANKYDLLEKWEDEQDAREAKEILARMRAGKEKVVSLEEFEKRTGIRLKPKARRAR
ncbi:MAG: hypothetical protein NTY90_00755 [Candidatus Micrarchaeota archaeon]|nr:hypothetical protein [Candidatus Micrarchaeota archaeon]